MLSLSQSDCLIRQIFLRISKNVEFVIYLARWYFLESHIFTNVYFVSKYSSSPLVPPSLPRPDSFTPPKGAVAVLIIPSLTPTIPFSSLERKSNIEIFKKRTKKHS